MIAADIFRPGQWTDFFLLVGTGAVTLTGLVFVAMSLNLKVIAIDATHRNRAINTLTGLALVFMRCALVLMGAQTHRSIGAELFVVSGISAAVFIKGYVRALRMGNGLRITRIIGGSLVHAAEMIGAALFFFGHLFGLYIAALAIVTNTCYMITAAWLLVIGALILRLRSRIHRESGSRERDFHRQTFEHRPCRRPGLGSGRSRRLGMRCRNIPLRMLAVNFAGR